MTSGVPDGEALYESAACGLVLASAEGTIVRANAVFCGWLGYTAAELVGVRRVQDLLTMGGRIFHQTHWAPLLQMQGSVSEVKLDVLHRDGHTVPMLFNVVRRLHGETVYQELSTMVVHDRHKYEAELLSARSKLNALNEKLSEADRRKTEFIATLAHELRNPLAPVRNGLEILKRSRLDDQGMRAREMMERQVGHMVHLIDDLMDISRIASGKIELKRELVEVRQVIDAALEANRPAVEAASHTLMLSIPDARMFVDADPTRMAQVLANVLNNAAKYTPRGGRIALEVELSAGWVEMRVRDNGTGIEPDKLAGVFEMFGQVAGTLNRAQGGLGIGLALARTLIEMHGGTIAARSEGLGQGTTFVLRLPVVAPGQAKAAPGLPARLPVRPLRVLIVEDNRDNADSMAMLMEAGGHEVRIALSGEEGIEVACEFVPDLVLTDIGLPDIAGYEVARRLRAVPALKQATLLALTGWGAAEDRRQSEEAGFDFHFTKPLAPEALAAFLQEQFPG